MKSVKILGLLAVSAEAYDAIHIGFFGDSNCAQSLISIDLTDITGCHNLPPFQSFTLNRSMTPDEQIDFSAFSNSAFCSGFIESVWNMNSSCRSLNTTATCINLWNNTGPSRGSYGPGWGWNSTTWVNTTRHKK